MAHTAMVFTHGNEKAFQFWSHPGGQVAHRFYNGSSLRRCKLTKTLVGDFHQFLCAHVPNHGNHGVLRGAVSVVLILPVVPLAADVRLGMDVPTEMDGDPIRDFQIERVT